MALIPHREDIRQEVLGQNVLEYFNYYMDTGNKRIYFESNPNPEPLNGLECGKIYLTDIFSADQPAEPVQNSNLFNNDLARSSFAQTISDIKNVFRGKEQNDGLDQWTRKGHTRMINGRKSMSKKPLCIKGQNDTLQYH